VKIRIILFVLLCLIQAYGITEYPIDQRSIESFKNSKNNTELVTENGIDQDQYIIGQGDQFTIYAINSAAVVYIGQVTQESDVFIPDVGLIKVGQVSLKNAKDIINQKLQNSLRGKNIEWYISLSKVKSANISLSGSVANPGTYSLRGNFRLLDAINKANRDTYLLNTPNSANCNIREIELIDKDTLKIDLYQFLYKNDLLNNPYVFPGQKIFVPYLNQKVFIIGPISNNVLGEVPIKKNESLRSLLELCVFNNSADTSMIYVKKGISGENIKTSFGLSSQIILGDQDIITVCKKADYPKLQMVSVRGEAQRPGEYAINHEKTTFSQMLSLAGGVDEAGDYQRACIIRRKNAPNENISKSINVSTISLKPELLTGLSRMSSFKDYTVISIKESNSNTLLCEGDIIYIPKKDNFVYVSGNVARCGAIEYEPSKEYSYYIKKAGGLTKGADRKNAFIVTLYIDDVMTIKGTKFLSSGDIIVVPEKKQYQFWSVVLLPFVTALLTSVSLFWTIYNSSSHK
jgi:polysaccharide biosynthesis/export protein